MKSIQAITVHSKQYIVGEPCHPPGFKDEATVMKITEKNKFYGLIRGFVVHFDTKKRAAYSYRARQGILEMKDFKRTFKVFV